MNTIDSSLMEQSRAWPFEEARKVAARLAGSAKPHALFETGYGPSGLPHIGTFAEVARTTMVRQAFCNMVPGTDARLLAFSDDMDGLRKVPDNVPNKDMLARHLGMPLTSVPDPFGSNESFGAHNNARLRGFLDGFGFQYEFASATEYYRSGRFDGALRRMLECFDEVMAVILPTLGPERRATYAPFLPLHPVTGIVMQVPVLERKADAASIIWRDPDTARLIETPVTGGQVKCQWKADWAMRWFALGVDYEMSGKDLIDSVKLSSRICRILGAEPPVGFTYELFLDDKGEKISKSKGNGLTIEEWLAYAPPESLATYMFQGPARAKRLYFDVIPRAADEYLACLRRWPEQTPAEQLGNPVFHVHNGTPPVHQASLSFSDLLTLAAALPVADEELMWAYVAAYAPGTTAENAPVLAKFVPFATAYFRDRIAPTRRHRPPSLEEQDALAALADALRAHEVTLMALAGAERVAAIKTLVYDAGRRAPFLGPEKDGRPSVSRAWFKALYEVVLGLEEGTRFDTFVATFGVAPTIVLIEQALARASAPAEPGGA
jgi:lysyl-tRNA synthetase class 1